MQVGGMTKLLMAATLLAATLAAGGCSTQIADLPAVGLPSDAPPRPKEAGSRRAAYERGRWGTGYPLDPAEQRRPVSM